jgi:solute carrier family 8 (sodium/calcium exchanger)
MEITSGAISDFFVAQKGMYNEDLEKASCREFLLNLVEDGIGFLIKNFVTDQNSKISKLVKDTRILSSIEHNYEIWHVAKNLKKKRVLLEKKDPSLEPFRRAICNHFWYSSQTCDQDPVKLVEIFHSTLLHLTDKHAWKEDPFKAIKHQKELEKLARKMKIVNKKQTGKKKKVTKKDAVIKLPYFSKVRKCNHTQNIKHRKKKGLKLLDTKSDAFKALYDLLTDTYMCNTLKKCNKFQHTGNLEVYHSVRLKLLSKRIGYKITRMIVAGMLVCIEVNSNLNNVKYKNYWNYCKAQGKYVTIKRRLGKDYNFRREILDEAINHIRDGHSPMSLDLTRYIKKPIPTNIRAIPRPKGPAPEVKSRFA